MYNPNNIVKKFHTPPVSYYFTPSHRGRIYQPCGEDWVTQMEENAVYLRPPKRSCIVQRVESDCIHAAFVCDPAIL